MQLESSSQRRWLLIEGNSVSFNDTLLGFVSSVKSRTEIRRILADQIPAFLARSIRFTAGDIWDHRLVHSAGRLCPPVSLDPKFDLSSKGH